MVDSVSSTVSVSVVVVLCLSRPEKQKRRPLGGDSARDEPVR
jgi:hypothetical protein